MALQHERWTHPVLVEHASSFLQFRMSNFFSHLGLKLSSGVILGYFGLLSWDTWGNQVPGSNKHRTIVFSTSWHFHRTPRNLCQMDPNEISAISEYAKSDHIPDAHGEISCYVGSFCRRCLCCQIMLHLLATRDKHKEISNPSIKSLLWWNCCYSMMEHDGSTYEYSLFQLHVQKHFSWLFRLPMPSS